MEAHLGHALSILASIAIALPLLTRLVLQIIAMAAIITSSLMTGKSTATLTAPPSHALIAPRQRSALIVSQAMASPQIVSISLPPLRRSVFASLPSDWELTRV
jgi:hypothetical protein